MSKNIAMLQRQHALAADDTPHRFYFVLTDQFSILALMSALETLQNANAISGQVIYDWRLISKDGLAVLSSLQSSQIVDGDLDSADSPRDIVIVSGADVHKSDHRKLRIWLSRHARGNVRVSGLCTGAWILAEAGLLNNQAATLHPWARDGFFDRYQNVVLSESTHLSEIQRCSSSSGVSSIDLFLDFMHKITELTSRVLFRTV